MNDVALQGTDAERLEVSDLVGLSGQNGDAPIWIGSQQKLKQFAAYIARASS
jgi:hypothetical protein